MNKKLAALIAQIVNKSPYSHFHCELIPPNTLGFWGVRIYFSRRGDAHSESLIRCIDNLGMVFGEKLWIDDKDGEVIIT